VPATLVRSTVAAATGRAFAGTIAATALSGTVVRTMFMTKLKIVCAGLLLIGAGAGGTAVMALQHESGRTGQAAVRATAETKPRGTQRAAPGAAEPGRVAETPQDGTSKNADEIRLRETELKRALDRLVWSLRMNAKSYVPDSALLKDHERVEKAILALERLWAKEKPRAKLPEEKSPEERKRDEVSILTKELQRLLAEANMASIRLEKAKLTETGKARLRDRTPDPLSEAEWKVAEAEVAAAEADRKLKQAQMKLLQLRLSQADP
jgi:hypothetical protein